MEEIARPFDLGMLHVANRLAAAPVLTGFARSGGVAGERFAFYYETLARGGAGLVIMESAAVSPEGREHPNQLAAYSDESFEGLSRVIGRIHAIGAKVAVHLNHAGGAANPAVIGAAPVAPSDYFCAARGSIARSLALGEIHQIIADFGEGAQRAEQAGADAIELQAGHGYLLAQFACPRANVRNDDFGRDRLRFARLVLQAIQSRCSLPVILRVSCSRPKSACQNEGYLPLVGLAEEQKVAALDATLGDACHALPWFYQHASLSEGPLWDFCRSLRRHTRLAILAGGRLSSGAKIRRMLKERLADVACLGRPLIADPQLPNKLLGHHEDAVMECGGCLQACLSGTREQGELACMLHPSLAEAPHRPASTPRNILVAGGGPSGMMAASILAERGHRVILAEAENELGGLLRLAARYKKPLAHPLKSMIRRTERSGATLLLGRRADEELLRDARPDVLVWAVGAEQRPPKIPGLSRQRLLTSIDYFLREGRCGGPRVLVLGATRLGLEAAEALSLAGHRVTVVESSGAIGRDMERVGRDVFMERLGRLAGLALFTNTVVERFVPGEAVFNVAGETVRFPSYDCVFVADGFWPKRPPPREWSKHVQQIHFLGDALTATRLAEATRAAHDLAARL